MKRYVILPVFFLAASAAVSAQESWGSSLSVEASRKFFRKMELLLEGEFRLRDDFSVPDRVSGVLEVNCKPWKYLKAGGAYNPIRFNHEKKGWETRHRYYFYLTGSYSYQGFTLSLRERFQSTYRVGVEETAKRANPKLFLRSRLKAAYDRRTWKAGPYVSVEFYKPLNDPLDSRMNKVRYTAGSTYRINKRHAVELFYRHTNFIDDDDTNGHHMIGLGYAVKF
jgi:hypothetical protein